MTAGFDRLRFVDEFARFDRRVDVVSDLFSLRFREQFVLWWVKDANFGRGAGSSGSLSPIFFLSPLIGQLIIVLFLCFSKKISHRLAFRRFHSLERFSVGSVHSTTGNKVMETLPESLGKLHNLRELNLVKLKMLKSLPE